MQDIVLQFGYLGLFTVSFLSASLLPLGSAAIVAVMPALGFNIWLVLGFATLGSFLGSLTNYYIGKLGRDFLFSRCLKIDPRRLAQAQALYQRWGAPILLFSWLPLIGDPLTVVAGLFQLSLSRFTAWVLIGKVLHHLVVLGLATSVVNVL